MDYRNVFGLKLNHKTVSLLVVLALLPNVLGAFTFPTGLGFNVHFFQFAVFLAALLFGPIGGILSGGFGSIFTALALNNPYIIIGNILLGGFTGFFARKGFNAVNAVMLAFAIQLPWLWFSDIFLAGMPQTAVQGVVLALLAGNLVWALLAGFTYKKIKAGVL